MGVLTEDNKFYIYDVILERVFQYQRDKYSEVQENESKAKKELEGVARDAVIENAQRNHSENENAKQPS